MSFLLVDDDYYAPWDTGDPGPRYHPGAMPDSWTHRYDGAWTHWGRPDLTRPDQGWKVHVSSSFANAQAVLTIVAQACVEHDISFKHLAGRQMFLYAHDKHAARVQSGKFCTLYPPDVELTRTMLERLRDDLHGIDGPYVLTDRRFGDSACVSYRYGAFRGRSRIDADGTHILTMIAPGGEEIDDQRRPGFWLPDGITDPFTEPKPSKAGPVTINGYTLDKVVRHSNAGGAYQFTATDGMPVFLKEAKAHNGYTGDGADAKTRLTGEYLVLRAIHDRAPGLCPKPVELFHHWEHTYLATEVVPGIPLYRWMVTNNPAVTVAPEPEDFAAYYQRCLVLLDQLDDQVRRLHDLGYVFIDLSPTNVLVGDDDRVRLVDFEAVQPIGDVRRIMGTPGYLHPEPRAAVDRDPRELDRYGLAALALMLVFPVHETVERNPAVLHQLHADLAPIPEPLWQRAISVHDRTEPPAPHDDPLKALRTLADRTADALEAMAQPDHPDRVYPTNPLGYQTNTRALAAGTAGVLLALHRAGRTCDPAVVRRLRDESLSNVEPGFMYGSPGIACVLSELGEGDAASELLSRAAKLPQSDTLGAGTAGTALGLLVHHRRTGEQRWLDLAATLIPDSLQLSLTTRSGLVGGRAGVALTLYHLYRATGDTTHFDRGMRLLEEELAYAQPLPVDGLGFKTTMKDRRVYPYLYAGSAGYAAVLTRYLAHDPAKGFPDAADVLERCLTACTIRFAVFPGLFPGLAGLAVTLADAGRRLGRPDLVDAAITSALGLFRHAVPHADGVAWLGEPGQRISTDLWSGSAGILLALRHLTLSTREVPMERSDQHGGSPAATGRGRP